MVILILEYGSHLKKNTTEAADMKNTTEAVDKAYSRYIDSDTHNAVQKCFLASSNQYSILQFENFILKHSLIIISWLLIYYFLFVWVGFGSVNKWYDDTL